MSRKPAFTLIEIIVASFLGALVLGVMVNLFVQFRRQAEHPIATVGMEQSTVALLSWLQHDLEETNTQSLYSLPDQGGVIMESARDDKGNLVMQPVNPPAVGTVVWQRFYYYHVRQIASPQPLPPTLQLGSTQVVPMLGELDYDEDTSGVQVEPGPPPLPPIGSYNAPNRHRVLARNLLIDKATGHLGCAVYYHDANGDHPFGTQANQRGEPVIVSLTLLDVSSSTGKPTVRQLQLKVKPRN